MTFTFDPTTSRGRVRLLVPDAVTPGHMFEDAEIDAYLAMNDDEVRLAAADAIETIAGSNAMVGKLISVNGLSANGAFVCNSLMARARTLRETATEYVGIASAAVDEFTWQEMIA